MTDASQEEPQQENASNFSLGTWVFGMVLGGLIFGLTYGLCLLTADESAKELGVPQDTALWTGLCVALGTIWVSLAVNITRQAIRVGMVVGLTSGMILDGMGSPAWLAVGLPIVLGLRVFWLHRKKEDVESIGDILK